VEGGEDLVVGRVHSALGALADHELLQLGPVGLGELLAEHRVPIRLAHHAHRATPENRPDSVTLRVGAH